ncbi:hypothetical protein EASAB2608_00461 [Streptomyces sp. EAS-AB2608]|nr:hypothetical protein EASAB2608_00461 [Streptomyces sp. EAS-AB2608]
MVVRDGVRLVCRDWGGAGPAVVLSHGAAGHAGAGDVPARRLTDRFRVVAVDQRGHGAAERHPRDVSRAAFVADVMAVVADLGLDRPVLEGQSRGGPNPGDPRRSVPGSTRGRSRSPRARRRSPSSAAGRWVRAGRRVWSLTRAVGALGPTVT